MDLEQFLKSHADVLKSATPKVIPGLEKNIGTSLLDIALHVPSRVRTIYSPDTINPSFEGKHVALSGVVEAHIPPRLPRRPYQIIFCTGPQRVFLTFFNGHPSMFLRTFPLKKTVAIVGVLKWKEQWQIVHPSILTQSLHSGKIYQPVYTLPESIHAQRYRSMIDELLAILPNVPEWIPAQTIQENKWPGWKEALIQAHRPRSEESVLPTCPAKQRLAFDELLAHNLSIGLLTYHQQEQRITDPLEKNDAFLFEYQKHLPFKLTPCQKDACGIIYNDLLASRPMLRLLQGDVGSGKTAVSFFTALFAAHQSKQSVILSPTEILVQQQYKVLLPLATSMGKTCAMLTAQTSRKERDAILAKLAHGSIDILLGTHAVLEPDVIFKSLNVVIIDEQHRFGVQQRLAIVEKGKAPHTLIMSATPIPRSLTLTLFGSIQVSRLVSRPNPFLVETKVTSQENIEDVFEVIRHQLDKKERIFWVCPLIEESETLDLMPVTKRFEALCSAFPPDQIALLHGRMKSAEKMQVIEDFRKGNILILVSTTVVEVGVDIPSCNFMIIENAEIFGLAQLHQLRGRVGRKGENATCLLLHHPKLSATAEKRLSTIRGESDGFRIAEEDLKLRGAGDVLGVKQSGLPPFKIADLIEHHDIYLKAQQVARDIIETNPFLSGNQGQRLRTLLRLLREDHLTYIHSG